MAYVAVTGKDSTMYAKSAVIYLRISQDNSGEGAGVERQREDCIQRCADRGWSVVAVHADNDVSAAGTKHRPGFDAMVHAVEDGSAQIVVAYALDRLQRNRRDEVRLYEACRKAGAALSLINGPDVDFTTATGRYLADNLGSLARLEIEMKGDRQRRAQEQRAKRGMPTRGRRAFGYEQDGTTVRAVEAAAVRDGYRRLLTGATIAEIARDWNGRGLTTTQMSRAGEPSSWRPDAVRAVLKNARNAGFREYQGTLYPATWPGLVTEATWRAARELLADPSRRSTPGTRARSLLAGVARCGVCGATIHAGGNGRQGIPGYRCSASMGHFARMAEPIDSYVSAVVLARLTRPDAIDLLVDRDRPDVDALRAEAHALRLRLESLATEFADGDLEAGQLKVITARLRQKIGTLEAAMADAGRTQLLGPLVGAPDVAKVWEGLTTAQRRAVIDTIADVVINPVGRGVRTFRPETVAITPKQEVASR